MYSQGLRMSTRRRVRRVRADDAKPGRMRSKLFCVSATVGAVVAACVPPGNSTQGDAGTTTTNATAAPTFRPSMGIMTAPFEDNFERSSKPAQPMLMPSPSSSVMGSASSVPSSSISIPSLVPPNAISAPLPAGPVPDDLGPNWRQAQTSAWHIENGRLCGSKAQNHGVWLNKILPINARIEFDAIADSPDGDLKAEIWGDGQSHATQATYNNATSYLTILGGWKNKFHVLARINEHAPDRKQIVVDPKSDDPTERPVTPGQAYRFKIERTDGKTVRWSVNGLDYLTYDDPSPLLGMGHDHFGFNDWEVKVCFDNVKVTPLP